MQGFQSGIKAFKSEYEEDLKICRIQILDIMLCYLSGLNMQKKLGSSAAT